jgi:hypothetical protein
LQDYKKNCKSKKLLNDKKNFKNNYFWLKNTLLPKLEFFG